MPANDAIVMGLAAGIAARLLMLRIDFRQYPTYPHGMITHLAPGVVSALIGAVFLPALMLKQYTAVTFLALAAQEFRQVREMERETLAKLDETELVPRGNDYIEGIAKTFEARNYLTIATATLASGVGYFWGLLPSLAVVIVLFLISFHFMHGKLIKDIAEVIPAKIAFQGAELMVDEIPIMNVGSARAREKILAEGLAVKIKPFDDNGRATINNVGQRQAIIHTAASLLGTKKDVGEIDFTPLARKNIDTGALGIFFLPVERDSEALIELVKRVPVLESAYRKPLRSKAGRMASD